MGLQRGTRERARERERERERESASEREVEAEEAEIQSLERRTLALSCAEQSVQNAQLHLEKHQPSDRGTFHFMIVTNSKTGREENSGEEGERG